MAIPGPGRAYNGQFSKSGKLFAAAWQGDQVALFDVEDRWRVLKGIEAQHVQWTISSVDLSPDEEFLIYSSLHEVVHLCNVRGEHELHEPLDLEPEARTAIYSAKFSPGGNEIVAGTGAQTILVYDVERTRLLERGKGHLDGVNSVAYVDSAYRPHLIASGADDSMIMIWDRRTMGKSGPAGVLPGHSEGITHVVGKGDGRYLLSNAKDQTAKLWDLRRMCSRHEFAAMPATPSRFRWDYRFMDYPGWGRPYKHPFDKSLMTYRGHTVLNTLIRCYFSPAATTGQRYIYSASQSGVVHAWDAVTGGVEFTLQKPGANPPVRDVSWHPHEPLIVTAGFDGTLTHYEFVPGGSIAIERGQDTLPVAASVYRELGDRDSDSDWSASGDS